MVASKSTKQLLNKKKLLSIKRSFIKSLKSIDEDFTDFSDFTEGNESKKNNKNNEEVLTKTIKKIIRQVEKTKLKPINTHCLIDLEKE